MATTIAVELANTVFANETIIPRKTKSMDMQFYWLRFRDAQGQFRYFWAPGPDNLGDYSTKNHLLIYHLSQRKIG